MEDTTRVIERVSALLRDASADAEDTLMDGYARALALEAERLRLERDLAAMLEERQPADLSSVRERISSVDEELGRLRGVLSIVRERLVASGAAAAESSAA